MACVLTSGRTEPCKDATGGVRELIFMDYIAAPFTVTAGQATAINAGITDVYLYAARAINNTFAEALVSDKNAGTTVNTQTLEVRLKKQTFASAAELLLLAHARPIIVVVGNDGSYKIMGISEGCDLTGSSIQSGGTRSEFTGYDLTFTAEEIALAPFLDPSTVTALIALISETNVTP